MWFWWFMLVCDIIGPLVMVIGGLLMSRRPPQKINSLVGYRTERSMASREAWDFAQRHAGGLMWRWGLITLIPAALVLLPFYQSADTTVVLVSLPIWAAELIALLLPMINTEKALKREFGNQKSSASGNGVFEKGTAERGDDHDH